MNKEEIIAASRNIFKEFTDYSTAVNDKKFFNQPPDKWSIAQNVDHLIRSMKSTNLAYTLPKFIVRMYAGKPNRPSRSYDELVAKYKLKLDAGGRATGRFIPKPITGIQKNELIHRWNKITAAYINKLSNNNDGQLDKYIVPHPLLGKITLRELCYFTIYHTQHHLTIIKQRNQ